MKAILATGALLAAAGLAGDAAAVGASPSHEPEGRVAEGVRARLPSLIATASADLLEKDGTLSWRPLGDIRIVRRENLDGRYGRGAAYFAEPVVRDDVRALAGRTVRVRGYMLPRMEVDGLSRVLVSGLPAADTDGCAAGGAETFVDAIIAGPVNAAVDRLVTVEGKLTLFDPERWAGYVYRLNEARVIEEGTAR